MSCETKVILASLVEHVGKAKTVKEAYRAIVKAASVEGMNFPSYEEFQKELQEDLGEAQE